MHDVPPSPLLLVVDDHDETREMVAVLLRSSAFVVVTASNGLEALEAARKRRPALIFLDLMMPGMGGEQFRELQLRDPNIAPVPVVVMSANDDAEVTATRIGAVACLTKPVDFECVLRTLDQYLPRPSTSRDAWDAPSGNS